MPGEARAELRRQLGLPDAVAIFVGIILGSGIFVAPAAVAGAAPRAWMAVAFWIVGGLVASCGALCYAECGARMPRTGGFYVYYREAYGEPLAFVGGWAALMVTYPASIAAIALIFGEYLDEVVPFRSGPRVPAAIALAASGLLNAVGVRAGALAQRLLTSAKVGVLALLCLAAVLVSSAPAATASASASRGTVPGLAALVAALVIMLWTYDGWSDVTLVTGEIREPARNLARAVILGVAVLIVLYSGVQVAVMRLLGAEVAAGSDRVLSTAVQAGLGPSSGRLMALLIVVSTLGSIHGIVLTSSRLGFAMARDRVFLGYFGRIHPRWGTPSRSVFVLVGVSVAYVLWGDFAKLLAYFSFSVWIFYGLTAIALVILRRRGIGEPAAWRTPGGVFAPVVVVLTAAGMTSSLMVHERGRALAGLGILAAGFVVYFVWRTLRRP